MAAVRNGNGRKGGIGEKHDVPRWVRLLFDKHEAHLVDHERRMASLEQMLEEIRAEGAARAAEHKAHMARLDMEVAESRRQTREIIMELSRIDAARKIEAAQRKLESARNLAEHRAFMAALKDLRGPR